MSSQNYWFFIYTNAYSSVLLLSIYSLADSTQSLLVPFISKESILVPILYIGLVGSCEKKRESKGLEITNWVIIYYKAFGVYRP